MKRLARENWKNIRGAEWSWIELQDIVRLIALL